MLKVYPESNGFTVQKTANFSDQRMGQAIVGYKGELCFVIGGISKEDQILPSVVRYNISTDEWEEGTPALNVARASAAGCTLGDNVFVFAGSKGQTLLNSVEWLDVTSIARGRASW